MRKISFKLGLLFFVFVLGIETILLASLYVTLVHSRINEEFEQLLARGNNHRDVLENGLSINELDMARESNINIFVYLFVPFTWKKINRKKLKQTKLKGTYKRAIKFISKETNSINSANYNHPELRKRIETLR
ncbi:hypothetical protein A7K69_16725 [Parageobacillus thermoglucosidasius]|uniref:Uncharacterized protein n=1 Tax=Parageobacillus thermoglucosidasius TaxID=1426 RepID=A0A1B7KV94_PARTM|nr:hypothetical protein A7K69_16725 [Parageobacillus thermoglucosidasius]